MTEEKPEKLTKLQHSRSIRPIILESQESKDETNHALFEFCKGAENKACVKHLLKYIEISGILLTDPRLRPLMSYLERLSEKGDPRNLKLDVASFSESLEGCSTLINQAVNKQMVIPDFEEFSNV